jgi:hypothetical protein
VGKYLTSAAHCLTVHLSADTCSQDLGKYHSLEQGNSKTNDTETKTPNVETPRDLNTKLLTARNTEHRNTETQKR